METIRSALGEARDFLKIFFHPSSETTYRNLRIIKSGPSTSYATDGKNIFKIDRAFRYDFKTTECPGVGSEVDIDVFHAGSFRVDRLVKALDEQIGGVIIYDKEDWSRNLANRKNPPRRLDSLRLRRIHKVG